MTRLITFGWRLVSSSYLGILSQEHGLSATVMELEATIEPEQSGREKKIERRNGRLTCAVERNGYLSHAARERSHPCTLLEPSKRV